MYNELTEVNKQGKLSFTNVVTFNMDEYVALVGRLKHEAGT